MASALPPRTAMARTICCSSNFAAIHDRIVPGRKLCSLSRLSMDLARLNSSSICQAQPVELDQLLRRQFRRRDRDPTVRVQATCATTGDVTVLNSTAASTASDMTLPPSARGGGGATQFFAPDTSGCEAK
jgi:hypothetical protein